MRGDGDRRGAEGPPVSRRVLLAAGGAVLLTSTAAAVAEDARAHSRGTQPRPAADGAAGPARARADAPSTPGKTRPATSPPARQHPELTRHAARPPQHAQPRLRYGEPMYAVQDGPKVVALTIDDGPSPVYTPQILKILRVPGGRAGGGCGRPHDRQPHLEPLQPRLYVGRGRARRDSAGDRRDPRRHRGTSQHVRAPYGVWPPAVFRCCAQAGLTPLAWSVDPRDWSRPGIRAIVRDIVADTRTGSIILEHDGGGNRSQTVAALKIWLPRLLDAGYQFTTP
jgi:peptidoglycan-N-acetylglucosamine deacetylase